MYNNFVLWCFGHAMQKLWFFKNKDNLIQFYDLERPLKFNNFHILSPNAMKQSLCTLLHQVVWRVLFNTLQFVRSLCINQINKQTKNLSQGIESINKMSMLIF